MIASGEHEKAPLRYAGVIEDIKRIISSANLLEAIRLKGLPTTEESMEALYREIKKKLIWKDNSLYLNTQPIQLICSYRTGSKKPEAILRKLYLVHWEAIEAPAIVGRAPTKPAKQSRAIASKNSRPVIAQRIRVVIREMNEKIYDTATDEFKLGDAPRPYIKLKYEHPQIKVTIWFYSEANALLSNVKLIPRSSLVDL